VASTEAGGLILTLPSAAAERYQELELVGRGGMGEVYRAVDSELGHPVALKVLLPEHAHKESRRERFRREVFIHRQLRHRNVVRFYDYYSDDACTFFTMEFVEGVSLRSLVAEGPLDPETAVELVAGLADGLAAAHRLRILHRDIKPDNVIVDETMTPKIMDFGLAFLTDDGGERLTRTGQVLGTFQFLPPEVLRNEEWDVRCDVYQVGLVLYWLLTRELPFTTEALADYAQGEPQEPVRPPSAHVPGLGRDLDALVMAAMAPDCRQRIPTARSLARACTAWLAGDRTELYAVITDDGQSVVKTARGPSRVSRRRAIRSFLVGFLSTGLFVVLVVLAMDAHRRAVVLAPPAATDGSSDQLSSMTAPPDLFWAAAQGDMAKVRALVAQGISPAVRDPNGWTALHHAAAAGRVELVEYLATTGVNLNAVNNQRMTPLHLAARSGRIEVVRLLLARGVRVNEPDADGRTALDVARDGGLRDVAELLERAR